MIRDKEQFSHKDTKTRSPPWRDSVKKDEIIAAGENRNLWNSGPNQSGLGQGRNMKFVSVMSYPSKN